MAGSLNKAQLIGNLTRDPEVKQTPSGRSVCSFGIATNRSWKDATGNKKEAVEFHNIVAWGKLAEICGQYLGKGRKVFIEGRLQTRDWEGQDGVKRYRTEIIADEMIMLDKSGGATQGQGGFTAPTPSAPSASEKQADPGVSPDDEIQIEDIPF